jgi:hypothetical protein
MEAFMRKVMVLFLLASAILVLAQEQNTITVKESSTVSGVVIVSGEMQGKSIDLQCNASSPSCQALKPGKYLMLQLPKNRGMYDCQNADVFELGKDTATDQRLAEYCLTVK